MITIFRFIQNRSTNLFNFEFWNKILNLFLSRSTKSRQSFPLHHRRFTGCCHSICGRSPAVLLSFRPYESRRKIYAANWIINIVHNVKSVHSTRSIHAVSLAANWRRFKLAVSKPNPKQTSRYDSCCITRHEVYTRNSMKLSNGWIIWIEWDARGFRTTSYLNQVALCSFWMIVENSLWMQKFFDNEEMITEMVRETELVYQTRRLYRRVSKSSHRDS